MAYHACVAAEETATEGIREWTILSTKKVNSAKGPQQVIDVETSDGDTSSPVGKSLWAKYNPQTMKEKSELYTVINAVGGKADSNGWDVDEDSAGKWNVVGNVFYAELRKYTTAVGATGIELVLRTMTKNPPAGYEKVVIASQPQTNQPAVTAGKPLDDPFADE